MSKATQNEIWLIVTVLICFAGTFFFIPFMPLYVQELGGFDVATTALWSGLILGATPLVSGIAAPFWGMLADRYGRRIMLQRSLFGFTLCLAAMGLATEPWHLLVIRGVEGIFGGFMASAAALISTTSPTERVSIGIGRIHAARVLGMAAGPIPGGLIADLAGYRVACFAAAALVAVAFFIVTFFTNETVRNFKKAAGEVALPSLRNVVITGSFLAIFLAVFVTRMAERSFDPVLPLLVAQTVGDAGAAAATSAIVAAGLVASSVAAVVTGHLVRAADRGRILILVLFLTALAFAPIPLSSDWGYLLACRIVVGILLGASLTLGMSIAATDTPIERRSAALGIIGSGSSYGSSLGFILAGVLSPISLTLIFFADAILILVSGALLLWARGWRR